jgi:hypothetical protein
MEPNLDHERRQAQALLDMLPAEKLNPLKVSRVIGEFAGAFCNH